MIQIANTNSQPQSTDLRIWLSGQTPLGVRPDTHMGQFTPSNRLTGKCQRGEFSYSEFAGQYVRKLSQSLDEMMLEEFSA